MDFLSAETAFLLGAVVLIYIAYLYLNWPKNLPPGPPGWPLIGYLSAFTTKQPHKLFVQLTEQYGDIVSLRIGKKLIILLGSFESIKEALSKRGEDFAGRSLNKLNPGLKPGLLLNDGDMWRDQRRFSLSTLRDFGFGKQSLDVQIGEEVMAIIKEINSFNGKTMDISNLLRMSVANVINGLVFGERFSYDDPKIQTVMEMVNAQVQGVSTVEISDYIPWPRFLRHHRRRKENRPIMDMLKGMIDKHKVSHVIGSERDYIDAWLTEKQSGKINKEYFTDEHLIAVVRSLFIAGSDTTASTLRWAIVYMMLNPEIQKKIQLELDEKIGNERMSSMNDRANVPYTEAAILEIQRMSTIVPFAIPHRTLKEVSIFGYNIPKDTTVLPNLWGVHHDPKIYPDPMKFKPERFLDEGTVKKHEMIAFGIGKRVCLGESLAKSELFLFFTSLMQAFTFKLPEGEPEPDLDNGHFGLILAPPSVKVCAVPRRNK